MNETGKTGPGSRPACDFTDEEWLWAMRKFAPETPFTEVREAVVKRRGGAERIARAFHRTYEELAPSHGYETRKESAVGFDDIPENNKSLMIAVAEKLLADGIIAEGEATP